jgi:hypothetical protein
MMVDETLVEALDGKISVPDVIPVFPLPGVVLLPGELLPLHIFEPRYRAMVRDALAGHRVFGMVDTLEAAEVDPGAPTPVQPIGCVGYIAQHQQLEDGRYLIWLVGLERFEILSEVEMVDGYRRFRVRYCPVAESAESLLGLQSIRNELQTGLPRVLESDDATRTELGEQLEKVTDTQLIALSCQVLELGAERKQELLQAACMSDQFMMVYEELCSHGETSSAFDAIDPGDLN